jgi:hypothetical protein
MPAAIALEPVLNDPLQTRVPLDQVGIFYSYGFPVKILSNSAMVLRAAEISFGFYGQKFNFPPLDVRVLVSDSPRPAPTEPPTFRSQGNLLTLVADSENFASLDLNTGFGFGWVTKATAEKTDYFRQCFLDVMIYCLLEIRHLVTVHSACVRHNNIGVLLTGPSGAGKSSLAYACTRRGWTYVSDDTGAFLRKSSSPVIIGRPNKFRFDEDVGRLFPEFDGIQSKLRVYGKPVVEVRTNLLDGLHTVDQSTVGCVVFLNRQDFQGGEPVLLPVSADVAWERLSLSIWAVQVPALAERVDALRRLLDLPTFEIRYGPLDPAIDLLETLAESLDS